MGVAGTLAFLGAALALPVLAGLALHAIATGRGARARLLARAGLGVIGFYAAALALFSFTSRDRVLGRSEEKLFCGADCDLAFSLVAAEPIDPIVPAFRLRPAHRSWLVSVRVRSDAARVTIRPSSARARVLDARGRAYDVAALAERELGVGDAGHPFDRALPPGESYVRNLVFELPADISEPRLLITEGGWISRLVPGDENSPFHRKTVFRMT